MGCSGQSRSGAAGHQKEDRQGGPFGCGPAGTHSDSLVSAKPPARARDGEHGSGMRSPRDSPQFHPPCRWISPSLTHTCEAKGSRSGGGRALNRTSRRPGAGGQAADTGLGVGTGPPPPPKPVGAGPARHPSLRAQQASRSKTQPTPKTNTGKRTREGTPTGQRSPEAPARDAAQDLTRHGRHGTGRAEAGGGGGE